MAEKSEFLSVKFDGKNYFSWEFQLKSFLRGKNLSGHIECTTPKPIASKDSSDVTKLTEWEIEDAKIMTWFLNYVDQLFILNLRPYKTAKGMWDYLKMIYNKDNVACKFQLELAFFEYSQGNKSIQ